MYDNEGRNASGLQIAFLIFAVIFLAYPIRKYLGPLIGLESGRVVDRLFIFVPMVALLLLVPAFRRFCATQLSTPIPSGKGLETGLVAAAEIFKPFAIFGAIVLWHWTMGGEMALARRLGQQRSVEVDIAEASTLEGLLFTFLLAGLVAPFVEELVFRGLIYRAWEAQWGWFLSMLATSALFAVYHPVPFTAFIGSLIFVAVLRRTGSIWAPIIVHAVGNLALSPLLMGRFYAQTAGKETGEIHLWPFHLAALAILAVALPVYVWMARDRAEIEEDTEISPATPT